MSYELKKFLVTKPDVAAEYRDFIIKTIQKHQAKEAKRKAKLSAAA